MNLFRAVCLLILLGVSTAAADSIHPDLQTALDNSQPNDIVSALIYLPQQVPLAELNTQLNLQNSTLRNRHETVVRALQQTALDTQGPLLDYLAQLRKQGRIADFRQLWIVNAFIVEATPDEIRKLAERTDVKTMFLDYEIELIKPVENRDGKPRVQAGDSGSGGTTTGGNVEPGIDAIRAPEVWDLGITGEGVLVSSLDTGVQGNHPALASRWAGVADPIYNGHPEWAWFDPVTFTTFPQAFGGHGTHTMGSACGGAPGDQIGVAPGSTWIHAAVIDRVNIAQTISDAILAFQWIVDPDGDPSTNFDVPCACGNSWGLADFHGVPDCNQTFWQFLDACEAAGVVMVFAAGNEGNGGLRRPADRATDDYRTLAVAAVNANNPNWPIAGFSSRGPTNCTPNGQPAIKPDIASPGVSVRSAWPNNTYANLDGTSMATPHITGVIALIRQANPNLTVEEIKQIMFDTAFDLGASGEDNSYGWGMVDAYEAVQVALSMNVPDFVPATSYNLFRGQLLSGTLADAAESDDQRIAFLPGLTLNVNEAPIWLIFDANVGDSTDFEFLVESQAGTPGLTFTVEAWNWTTSVYDMVGSQDESFNSDTVEVYALNSAAHFDSEGNVRSRIGWRRTGLILNFPWQVRIDQLGWNPN